MRLQFVESDPDTALLASFVHFSDLKSKFRVGTSMIFIGQNILPILFFSSIGHLPAFRLRGPQKVN